MANKSHNTYLLKSLQQKLNKSMLCEVVKQHWQKSAKSIREAVINDVRQFIGQQKVFDDMTLLVLKQK